MAVLRAWKVDAVLERRRAHTSALLKTSLLGGVWPDTPEQGQVRGRPSSAVGSGLRPSRQTGWRGPTRLGGTAYLESCPIPKFFVQSTNDEHGPRPDLERLFAGFAEPKRLVWVEANDHFFAGGLQQLEEEVSGLGAC